jgi:hypothetical protein
MLSNRGAFSLIRFFKAMSLSLFLLFIPIESSLGKAQWVTVELGVLPSNFKLTTSLNWNGAPMCFSAMNDRGEVAGSMLYSGPGYTSIEVMASWHPVVSISGANRDGEGYVKPGDILRYNPVYPSGGINESYATVINNSGVIAGPSSVNGRRNYYSATWNGLALMGFWGKKWMGPFAINDSGIVVGAEIISPPDKPEPMVFRNGQKLASLRTSTGLSGSYSTRIPFSINESRYVCGTTYLRNPGNDSVDSETGGVYGGYFHRGKGYSSSATVWRPDGYQEFSLYSLGMAWESVATDINESNHIIGIYEPAKNTYPGISFLMRSPSDGYIEIPNPYSPRAKMIPVSVNELDHVCGYYNTGSWDYNEPDGPPRAFYWEEGDDVENLGSMGLEKSWALRINEAGTVFGMVQDSPTDFIVRWNREQAEDTNADGIDDTEQDTVVNFITTSGVPVYLESSGELSEVWSSKFISDTYSEGLGFSFYHWDVPLGVTHFKVKTDAPGGAAVVVLKSRLVLPYEHDHFAVNEHGNYVGTGDIYRFSYDQASATGAILLEGNSFREALKVELHLVDGGRGDCDGLVNGSVEFFGGPFGITAGGILNLMKGNIPALTAFLGPTEEQMENADRNGDGKVDVADLIKDIVDQQGYPMPEIPLIPNIHWSP